MKRDDAIRELMYLDKVHKACGDNFREPWIIACRCGAVMQNRGPLGWNEWARHRAEAFLSVLESVTS